MIELQLWSQGYKPANASSNDIETDQANWGSGTNVTTKLVNPGGEVRYFTRLSIILPLDSLYICPDADCRCIDIGLWSNMRIFTAAKYFDNHFTS